MNPAAVYLRVSKDDGSQTTENQRPEVMQMAAGRGYVVAAEHVYVDEASGAKGADERPALRALLDAAARGRIKAVVVWRVDRLSRDDSFRGGLMMIGELDRFGVALLSHQEVYLDTAGPFRGALVQIALTLAAEERRTLIRRTNTGIARARAQLARGPYWNEKKKKMVTAIGRPKVEASAALIDRAAEIRRTQPFEGWRFVARTLAIEGFQRVPNFATLRRLCTKAYPDLPRSRPGWSRG